MADQVRTFTLVTFLAIMACVFALVYFGAPYLERTTGIPQVVLIPIVAIVLFLAVRTWLAAKARQAKHSSSLGDRNG